MPPYKILIVEDEKPIADLLDMSLTAAGYACDCLDSIKERFRCSFILSRSAFRPSRQFFRKESIPSARSRADCKKL